VVSDRQIESVLGDQIQQMVRQLGSEKRVEEYFGSSLTKVKRDFRKEVEERLLVQRLRETKNMEIQISRREVESFYSSYQDSLPELKESVKLQHILVNVEASESALGTARDKAEKVLKRLRSGEDFEALAREFSEDPGSASRGGNLGTLQRGDLVREYEAVAFDLEPGQISEVVQSQFGLHIIQLLEKTGEKINTRHILFRVDTSQDDEIETQKRLLTLKDRILANELTFTEAAKEYSKDEQTKSKGGDLGWFQVDEFQIKAFEEGIKGLKPGDISPPIKTQFGYHLIKLVERRDARQLSITEDWEQIENWALEFKRRQEFEKYVANVREDVYIEIKTL